MQEHLRSDAPDGAFQGSDRVIDKFTQGYVRKRARQLAGKRGFQERDRDEIEQQLFLKLAKHLDAADPDSPKWKAFVAKTVSRQIASMIRDNGAEKRDRRRVQSINVVVAECDEGVVELGDTISENEARRHRGCCGRSEQDLTDLASDMEACLADLPDERYREFCERLKYDSIAQVARDMEIPRTTLNAWLSKIRERFEERGLRDYLKSPSSVS